MNGNNDLELPELSEKEIDNLKQEAESYYNKSVNQLRQKKYSQNVSRIYFERLEAASYIPKTAEELLDMVLKKYGPALAEREKWEKSFEIPDQLIDLYRKLSLYFSGDDRMPEERLSPKKGLLIFGNVGCGKTSALKVFEKNPIQPYRTIMCGEIIGEYESKGNEVIEKYSENKFNDYKSEYFNHEIIGYAFDDLGTEKIGNHFRSTTEVMAEIIMRRYDNPSTRGNFTHITTNILPEDILTRYGLRVYDRMKSMFNIIQIDESAISLRC